MMKNDFRNIDNKCLYCHKESGVACKEDCFTYVFTKSVLKSPAFIPSANISKTVGKLFAEELLVYMGLVTRALEDLSFMGRMQLLSKDYEDLHNFANTLHLAGVLNDVNSVFDFYKDPKRYENYSRMWIELDRPISEKADGWDIFMKYIEVENGK
jgi:hypothetical protein